MKHPLWIPIYIGGMLLKETEKVYEAQQARHQEPLHHKKSVIDGIVVYESFRSQGNELWECLLQSMGKH